MLNCKTTCSWHEPTKGLISCSWIRTKAIAKLGYEASDLVGFTIYQHVHPFDQDHIRDCHLNLLDKEQAITRYYRFLCKGGGYVWMQSYSTVVHSPRSSRKDSIVSVHYVLSSVQEAHLQFNILDESVRIESNLGRPDHWSPRQSNDSNQGYATSNHGSENGMNVQYSSHSNEVTDVPSVHFDEYAASRALHVVEDCGRRASWWTFFVFWMVNQCHPPSLNGQLITQKVSGSGHKYSSKKGNRGRRSSRSRLQKIEVGVNREAMLTDLF